MCSAQDGLKVVRGRETRRGPQNDRAGRGHGRFRFGPRSAGADQGSSGQACLG
jgi:hypothetical protein